MHWYLIRILIIQHIVVYNRVRCGFWRLYAQESGCRFVVFGGYVGGEEAFVGSFGFALVYDGDRCIYS